MSALSQFLAGGGHSEVAAGAIVFGTVFEIGQTRFGASASIIDWSRKERDDYGIDVPATPFRLVFVGAAAGGWIVGI